MILREYKKEDADIIATWIKTEEELYKWSADRFNKYPISGEDICTLFGQIFSHNDIHKNHHHPHLFGG